MGGKPFEKKLIGCEKKRRYIILPECRVPPPSPLMVALWDSGLMKSGGASESIIPDSFVYLYITGQYAIDLNEVASHFRKSLCTPFSYKPMVHKWSYRLKCNLVQFLALWI